MRSGQSMVSRCGGCSKVVKQNDMYCDLPDQANNSVCTRETRKSL
jgi:hypothetical protein